MSGTRNAHSRSTFRAALLIVSFLAALGAWRFPIVPDGLIVFRTAESLAFEGTFTIPNIAVHSWFVRPAPDGGPGVVSIYQPFSALWRAAILRTALLVPPGVLRGALADVAIYLVPILFTALTVFPLARLFRYGGLGRRWAPFWAAALLVTTFLGHLGTTDFSEPGLVLALTLGLERALRARRQKARNRDVSLLLAGAFTALANLVKPLALGLVPAILLATVLPRGAGFASLLGRPEMKPRLRDVCVVGLGAVLPTIAFLVLNVVRSGKALEIGYLDQPLAQVVSPLWTVVRLLVLPNRGLFWYAPLSILAVAGAVILLRSRPRRTDGLVSLLGFGAYFSINVAYWAWDGGMGWGPRYLAPALALLAPVVASGVRVYPRAAVLLATLGLLLNLPGYLIDWRRTYDLVESRPVVPPPVGPIVPIHLDKGTVALFHRVHYIPSQASLLVAPQVLYQLLRDGDPRAAGRPSPYHLDRSDSVLLRTILGVPPSYYTSVGRILLDEADITARVDQGRALRFVYLSLDFGGPPVDARALGAYLALRLQRFEEAERLAREGLELDPTRPDLVSSLDFARKALGRS